MNNAFFDLSGKVAIVTGAGGVLCGNFSRVLAKAGAKVALLDIDLDAAKRIADEIKSAGGTAEAFYCDVLDKESCETAASEAEAIFGPFDILVNGAGGNSPLATTKKEYCELDGGVAEGSFFELDPEKVGFVFDLNFLGILIPSQVFCQRMLGREGCCVINISSMNAFTPLTKIPAYSGAKAAVSNFTKWLAVHFSKVGIRVNAIAPGFFSTAQNAKLLWNDDGTPTARTGKILGATPMGRFGVPEELDGALLFLADGRASGFVTGVVIPVDGGFSAYSGV